MQFKVGDRAVYPAHGVGIINAIETQELEPGYETTFYILKILDNGMTIMVPVGNAETIGMREVINPDSIEEVYDVLRDRETPTDNQTWNRRYREYMAKIKTGDPLLVARVLRDLALMKMEKNLSFGERKMFDQARNLLVQELSAARDCEESVIEEEISSLFVAPPESKTKGKGKGKSKSKGKGKSAKKAEPAPAPKAAPAALEEDDEVTGDLETEDSEG